MICHLILFCFSVILFDSFTSFMISKSSMINAQFHPGWHTRDGKAATATDIQGTERVQTVQERDKETCSSIMKLF